MKILSIQSSVAYGHVGNSAAVFPLQRLGHEVWPVLTVHFSNHTGYGAWRGPLLDPADVREVIAGIDDRGVLGECDAVLSGYQGDPAVGAVILDAVATVKAVNPDAVYCCDPVMGDVGRGHVRPARDPGVHARHRRAAGRHPHAQPLRARLPGRPRRPRTLDEVLAAVDEVRDRGPRDVLVTSVLHGDVPDGLARRRRGLRRRRLGGRPLPCCRSPRTAAATSPPRSTSRTCTTTGSPGPALERTTASVFAVLEATLAAGTREIQLVAAQDAIAVTPDDVRRPTAALTRPR